MANLHCAAAACASRQAGRAGAGGRQSTGRRVAVQSTACVAHQGAELLVAVQLDLLRSHALVPATRERGHKTGKGVRRNQEARRCACADLSFCTQQRGQNRRQVGVAGRPAALRPPHAQASLQRHDPCGAVLPAPVQHRAQLQPASNPCKPTCASCPGWPCGWRGRRPWGRCGPHPEAQESSHPSVGRR